jgi:hypothetical protein
MRPPHRRRAAKTLGLASVGWVKAPTGPRKARPDGKLRAVPTRSFTEVDQKIAAAVGERKRVEKHSTFDLAPPIAGHQSVPKRFGGHGASRRPPYARCDAAALALSITNALLK